MCQPPFAVLSNVPLRWRTTAENSHSSAYSFLPIGRNGVTVAFNHQHLGCFYYLVKIGVLRSALFAHYAGDTPFAHHVSQAPELFS